MSRTAVTLLVALLAVSAACMTVAMKQGHPDGHLILLRSATIDTTAAETRASHYVAPHAIGLYLLHVEGVLSTEEKSELERKYGFTLDTYVPHHTYVVEATPTTIDAAAQHDLVAWVGPVPADAKVCASLRMAAETAEEGERVVVRTLLTSRHRRDAAASTAASVRLSNMLGGHAALVTAAGAQLEFHTDAASLATVVDVLSASASVEWLERAGERRYLNHEATWVVQSNSDEPSRPFWAAGLNGEGEVIGVADTGLDTEHCAFGDAQEGHHVPYATSTGDSPADSGHRKVRAYLACGDAHDDSDGHGTFVTSSLLGRAHAPLSELATYDGLAKGARVAFVDTQGDGVCLTETSLADWLDWQYAQGARVSSNSWGEDGNMYSADAHAIDAHVAAHDDMVVVVAAGDVHGAPAGAGSLSKLANAKNAIAVGSSSNHVDLFNELSLYDRRLCSTFCQNTPCGECLQQFRTAHQHQWKVDSMPAYSAHGPTADNRLKPDLLAPGRFVVSARAGAGSSCLEANNFVALDIDFDDADEIAPEEIIASKNVELSSNACGGAVGAGALVFNGNEAGARYAATGSFDVADGGSVWFDLALGSGACTAPGAGEPLELQYGLFNGNTLEWTTWRTFAAADYSTTPTRWNEVFVASDALASSETRFRFLQTSFEDNFAQQHVWVIDNVRVESKATPEGLLRAYDGTSVSTPFVAAAASIVRQYFRDGFYPSGHAEPTDGFAPSAALVKAMLLNSAEQLDGLVLYKNDDESIENMGPVEDTEYAQGFGRLVLERGVPLADAPQVLLLPPAHGEVDVAHGEPVVLSFTVATRRDVQVTAVWTDPVAAAMAGVQLVNNVDLTVTRVADGETYVGNAHVNGVLGGAADDVNNVEQVLLENPLVGEYTVTLAGTNIPSGTQRVALVVRGDVRGVPSVTRAPTLVGDVGVSSATVRVDMTASVGLEPAAKWVVEVQTSAGGAWSEAAEVAAGAPSGDVELTGLPHSSDIRVRTYAVSAAGDTTAREHGPALLFHTLDLLAPAAPIAPTVTFAFGEHATLVHTVPFDNYAPVEGYVVRWAVQGSGAWEEMEVDGADTLLHRLSGLAADATYEVQVRAVNAVGAGGFSPSAVFSTHQATVPHKPHVPFVTDYSTLHLLIRWNAPLDGGSPITHYELEIDDGKGGRLSTVEIPAGGDTWLYRNVTRLRRRLDYTFRVAAVNAEGQSEWSELGTATTNPPPAVDADGNALSTGGGDDDSTRRAVATIFGIAGVCMVVAILLHLYMQHHRQQLRLLKYYENTMWAFVLIGLLAALTGIIWAISVNADD